MVRMLFLVGLLLTGCGSVYHRTIPAQNIPRASADSLNAELARTRTISIYRSQHPLRSVKGGDLMLQGNILRVLSARSDSSNIPLDSVSALRCQGFEDASLLRILGFAAGGVLIGQVAGNVMVAETSADEKRWGTVNTLRAIGGLCGALAGYGYEREVWYTILPTAKDSSAGK